MQVRKRRLSAGDMSRRDAFSSYFIILSVRLIY